MPSPTVKSGKLVCGADVTFGENVVIDVAEECVIGDRSVVGDNAYLGGRRVAIGADFFGYSWEWRRLDVGRGRIDEEDAVLMVGDRCTFHDNKIDLARRVTIGHDVGLSPEAAIYTHYYWQSPLEGFPCRREEVYVGDGVIVGFRSTILPGSFVAERAVIGAGAVVSGTLEPYTIYAGVPAKAVRMVEEPSAYRLNNLYLQLVEEYSKSCKYRGIWHDDVKQYYPYFQIGSTTIDLAQGTLAGPEDGYSDDLRWFLFTRGIRVYTKRPFRKLGRVR